MILLLPLYVRIYVQYNIFTIYNYGETLQHNRDACLPHRKSCVVSEPSVLMCSPPTASPWFDSPGSFTHLQCVAALAGCLTHLAPLVCQPPTVWLTLVWSGRAVAPLLYQHAR